MQKNNRKEKMINPKKTLEKVLIKFDKFLDYTSDSLIDNEDYNTIHKIYDKYDKLNKQTKGKYDNRPNA